MSVPGLSLPDDRYRRIVGFEFGALAAATYGAASQLGDRIAIPGAPLYQPPFGPAGNLLVFAIVGGVLGLIAAWPRSGLAGTFLAAGVSAVVVLASAFTGAGASTENLTASIVTGIFLALPFWGLLVLLVGPLRWVVTREEEAKRDGQPASRRMLAPAVLVLVVGLVGLTALYPSDARVLITRMDQMLKSAQASGSVPEPLAGTAFATRGTGPYELSWERQRIERYQIPRPAANFDQHSVVVARFKNGWNVVCLYTNLTDPPMCRDMEVIPR